MLIVDCKRDRVWLPLTLEALRCEGSCIVTSVIDESLLVALRKAMYQSRDASPAS